MECINRYPETELETRMNMPAYRRLLLAAVFLTAATAPACAQISFTSAVDLALRNSPKVRSAQAQVDHASAELSDTRDAYIPSVSALSGIGEAFGYSPYPPTLFQITAGSLLFNFAQRDYIRSARSGLTAAQLALQDAREAVAEDAALTFIAVDHDQQREDILTQQLGFAKHLVKIVEQRHTAGYDTDMDLTEAQLREAQLELNLLHAQDETANDRLHLGVLIGTPAIAVQAAGGFPDQAFPEMQNFAINQIQQDQPPAVAAAFASAKAKQEQAFGDKRFLYRPQVNLIIQYSHYATFTDAFHQLHNLYPNLSNDNQIYGVQINIPLLDKSRQARARETAADAVKAYSDAQSMQSQIFEAQSKLNRSLVEIQARAKVAALEQQRAQQQLAVVRLQQNATAGSGPAVTPKDEQNANIAEREKYLAVVDAGYQLRQAEVSILRQTGRLEAWLQALIPAAPQPAPTR